MSGINIPVESQVKYLKRRQDEIGQLAASLKSTPDWELMKKIGHQIKGNASTFGFPELTEIGKNLEQAGLKADAALAQKIAAQLADEVQRLLSSVGN